MVRGVQQCAAVTDWVLSTNSVMKKASVSVGLGSAGSSVIDASLDIGDCHESGLDIRAVFVSNKDK